MGAIDLRSDTVTLPTAEMRRAMADAEVGDDVWGEDPTVISLQERAAELTGKEAALFVPSGTMGNRLGILVNAPFGHALIADSLCHVNLYEAGGGAAIGGVQLIPIATERGVMTVGQLEGVLSPDDPHYAPTVALSIENTHNRHGGVVWPLDALRDLCAAARRHGLRIHLDGARLFNAAIACGVSASDLARDADTVTFCLSKGLACPVGSLFCGTAADIHEALRWRKMLGGGMRQAGIIAAAGIVALDTMIDRLADDHANARTLAEALVEMPGVTCDIGRVETNMVYAVVDDAARFAAAADARGVLVDVTARDTVRLVTHHGVDAADVRRAIDACAAAARDVAMNVA